jgi:succinate dehydrogenase hydrophobic anchor subunit
MPATTPVRTALLARWRSKTYRVFGALAALATAALSEVHTVIGFLPVAREYVSTPVARGICVAVIAMSVVGFVMREMTHGSVADNGSAKAEE